MAYQLAPGHLLQRMYIRERVRRRAIESFVELGSGNGHLSNLLLEMGMSGVGYDLNRGACENNAALNARFIGEGRYEVREKSLLDDPPGDRFDLVISSMVLEHLPDECVSRYLDVCRRILRPDGLVVSLAPASMRHWGIARLWPFFLARSPVPLNRKGPSFRSGVYPAPHEQEEGPRDISSVGSRTAAA